MPGDVEVSFYAVVRGFLFGLLQSEKHYIVTQRDMHACGSTVIPKMKHYHVLIISASFNISDWRLAL